MHFALTEEISEDVYDKVKHITKISLNLGNFFNDKNYGIGINTFLIGINCVAPGFDFFFKEIRKKYVKSKKELSYDIKLDHSEFKNADKEKIKIMLFNKIINSLDIIAELNIKEFDTDSFKRDLEDYFNSEEYKNL